MRNFRFYLVVFVLLLWPTQKAAAETATNFGTLSETWDAEISPGGQNLALGCSPQGVRAICIYDLIGNSKPKLIPAPAEARLTGFYWATDQYLLFSINFFESFNTSSGIRRHRINRMMSYDLKTGKSVMLMRRAKAFTDTTQIESMLVDDDQHILMALALEEYVIYRVNLRTGKLKIVDRDVGKTVSAVFDEKGKRFANIQWQVNPDRYAIQSVQNSKKVVYEKKGTKLAPFGIIGLTDARDALVVRFDTKERQGLHTLSLIDGAIAPYRANGRALGNVSVLKDRHLATIVGYTHTDDTRLAEYTDPELKNIQSAMAKALGTQNIWLLSWTKDRSEFTIRATKSGRPSQYYSYQPASKMLSPLGGVAPWLDSAALGTVKKITYRAQDGLEIPAYLTLPAGKTESAGPFPLVLLPHGGPESRDTIDYDWMAQALAQEGFMVLQPNFRGSSGYGRAFRNAGFNEFGDLMVQDVLDGMTYLQQRGLADQRGACAMGASYGGYSALMMGLMDQSKIRCVISINGVTDPYEIAGRWASDMPGAKYWSQYMGDRYIARDLKTKISPLERVRDYNIPVLLMHGKEDTTVPYAQSEVFAIRAKGMDKIRFVPLEGADHYLGSSRVRIELLTQSLSFLKAHHPARSGP